MASQDFDVRPVYDDSPESFNYEGAKALFKAVVLATLRDAMMAEPTPVPSFQKWEAARLAAGKGAKRNTWAVARQAIIRQIDERRKARKWLTEQGPNFTEICECAGLNPSYVHRKVGEIERNGWRPLERGLAQAA